MEYVAFVHLRCVVFCWFAQIASQKLIICFVLSRARSHLFTLYLMYSQIFQHNIVHCANAGCSSIAHACCVPPRFTSILVSWPPLPPVWTCAVCSTEHALELTNRKVTHCLYRCICCAIMAAFGSLCKAKSAVRCGCA